MTEYTDEEHVEQIAVRLARIREIGQHRDLGDWGEITEVVYMRYLGEISTEEMLTRLKNREYTLMIPRNATVADSDGPTGSWHDLTKLAIYDRLLTREELMEIQAAVHVYDPRPPEADEAKDTNHETPLKGNTTMTDPTSTDEDQLPINDKLAAALPNLPQNQFWRVRTVYETQGFNLRQPSLRDALVKLIPKVNPDKVRVELRENIANNVLTTLNGNNPVSQVLDSAVVDISGSKDESGDIGRIVTEANRLLFARENREATKTRSSQFTGDYRR